MGYVTTSGKEFRLDGVKYFPYGAAIYGGWTNNYIDVQIDNALHLNLNILRLINWMGQAAGTDEYAESLWTVMDHALVRARLRGIKLLIDFSDYTSILLNRGIAWQNQDWTTFSNFFCNRVNTENGIIYKNDDTIAFISIAGEPGITDQNLVTFYSNVSQKLQADDPNHLIGFGGLESHHPWQDCINLPTIDYGTCHPYGGFYDFRFGLHQGQAASANKPWFAEEVGFQIFLGDQTRAAYFRELMTKLHKYNGQGMLFWNFYMTPSDVGQSYNVGKNWPQTFQEVKELSFMKVHNPRKTVAEVDGANNIKPTTTYKISYSPYTSYP